MLFIHHISFSTVSSRTDSSLHKLVCNKNICVSDQWKDNIIFWDASLALCTLQFNSLQDTVYATSMNKCICAPRMHGVKQNNK